MEMLSIRRGFRADHSSTSYEFLAAEEPLDEEARKEVGSLSSRTNPSRRRASFIYHQEGYGIPGGWKDLIKNYYDVMYSESYGWWTISFAFNLTDKETREELREYDFRGIENLGIEVEVEGERVVLTIYARLNPLPPQYEDWSIFDGQDLGGYEPEDYLLALFTALRVKIINGDYRPLHSVWEEYGLPVPEEEEELGLKEEREVPKPSEGEEISDPVVNTFASLLKRV